MIAIEVGQVWQRKPPHKQRFRVGRVWVAGRGLCPGEPEIEGQTVVRLEPLNGGRESVYTSAELQEHCTFIESPRSVVPA